MVKTKTLWSGAFGMTVLLTVAMSVCQAAPGIPAFPGAEGFGASTPGGRYGQVLFVTTLEDYHPEHDEPIPGSLRWACTMPGARIVIFRVSGTIILKDKLVVTEPFITIAGQSAPGDGICLRRCSMAIGDAEHPVRDVVVRYLRMRPGPHGPQHYNEVDALSVEHANNVVIDHCSLSWDVDETLSIKANWWNSNEQGREYYQVTHDVTVQYCILSESLSRCRHGRGEHSKTLMVCGGANRVTVHHNLLMHGNTRNPLFPCEQNKMTIVDFVNNVVYNFGDLAGHSIRDSNQQVDINFVGNWYIMGPNSKKIPCLIHNVDTRTYARGNIGPIRTELDMDEYAGIQWRGPRKRSGLKAPERFYAAPEVTQQSYKEACKLILQHAGASLPKRDAVDQRLLKEFRERKGSIINYPKDVGGWPELKSAPAPTDSDRDGMPDEWERKHGLDPSNPDDHRADADGDGYTNIEEWLNGTPPRVD